ncbi:MAG: exosortase H [Candidatus Competibacter sp.]|nr:exosortase H [Candidatus Competibacter sp.]
MRRFLLAFIGIGLLLYGIVYLPPVRAQLIEPFTASLTAVAGGLIALFGGQVWVHDNVLSVPGFSVRILDLCNGVEATLLLWTAMLAFPAPWRHRALGLLAGWLAVQALNMARIISLVYLGVWKPAWFYWVHWYVWDALILMDVLLVFLLWLRRLPLDAARSLPHARAG